MNQINGLTRPFRQENRVNGRQSARDLNTLSRMLNGVSGQGGASVRLSAAGGLVVDAGSVQVKPFGHTRGGAVVTVRAGTIRVHGRTRYRVPRTIVTMSSAPHCWIYVEVHDFNYAAATIQASAEEPQSDNSTLRWPLAHYELYQGRYVAPRDGSGNRLWDGDIHIVMPIRT